MIDGAGEAGEVRIGERLKHYGTFGLSRVATQVLNLRRERGKVPAFVEVKLGRLRRDEARILAVRGTPAQGGPGALAGARMLVVGPGQLLREARYFAVANEVVCVDLDVIPRGIDPLGYARMLRANGLGRVIKTVGRKLVGNDRLELATWRRALGVARLPEPPCVVGDICDGAPAAGSWDVVASWSVFQSVPDPDLGVRRMVEALCPGGVLYLGVQLWTCNTGHHDIRAFSGQEDALPLWGHLRPSHAHLVEPSAYLNRLRLADWRAIFARHCPGFVEHQDRYDEDRYRAKMTPALRDELADYDDEELYSVDVFFAWRKPD